MSVIHDKQIDETCDQTNIEVVIIPLARRSQL